MWCCIHMSYSKLYSALLANNLTRWWSVIHLIQHLGFSRSVSVSTVKLSCWLYLQNGQVASCQELFRYYGFLLNSCIIPVLLFTYVMWKEMYVMCAVVALSIKRGLIQHGHHIKHNAMASNIVIWVQEAINRVCYLRFILLASGYVLCL